MKTDNPERDAPSDHTASPHNRGFNPAAALADASLRAAALARLTGGLAPGALALAYLDWAAHLAMAPKKQAELLNEAIRNAERLTDYAYATDEKVRQGGQDQRFSAEGWNKWPFSFMANAFQLQQQWWQNATTGVPGVSRKHEDLVAFTTRQVLDTLAPSSFPLTNPELLWRTIQSGGSNLVEGFERFVTDAQRVADGTPPPGAENFAVGQNVAITPGYVVHRNEIAELIQYASTASAVRPEPILLVPSWLTRSYIFDLSPHDSLVKLLCEQGFTVFLISWKNSGPEDRNFGLEDYRTLGVMEALTAINAIAPYQKVHAAGYSLGGTLLAIAATAMARDGDDRLATLTLLAAETDFTEAGEMARFVDEGQIAFVEDMMRKFGLFDSRQMTAAFETLHSKDLAFSRAVREYLLDESAPVTDLVAWSADTMRVPFALHSECMRALFLGNDFAQNRLSATGQPVKLCDLHIPVFVVGAENDHLAPWRSTFQAAERVKGQVTYVLASGEHDAAILSEPGRAGIFRIGAVSHPDDPERFLASSQPKQGSWWLEWTYWLSGYSGPANILQAMGAPQSGYPVLEPSPGSYMPGR